MKKKFTIILSALMATAMIWDYHFQPAHTNSGGAPIGNTGSPADGQSCSTSCHTGQPGATDAMVDITSDVPETGYVAETTYNFTVTMTKSSCNKFGFQISPQSSSGTYLGTLIAGTGSQIVGTKYLTHTSAGTSGSGVKSWNFQWTAPAGQGDVTFYGAFNFTNSNNNQLGDVVLTDTYTVSPSTVGVTENAKDGISIYPNPVTDVININARDVDEEIFVRLYSIDGRKVLDNRYDSGQINVDLRGKSLTTGVYFLELERNGNQTVRKIMVK